MITTASRAEYAGHALEAVIRERVANRRWHRHHAQMPHSDLCRMGDLERENRLILRELFRVRREGLRQHRAESARVREAYRETFSVSLGDPLTWTENEARWAWGDR